MRSPARCLLLLLPLAGCELPGEARFHGEALPILERRCFSPRCHGVAPGAEAAGEVIDRRRFVVDLDERGRARDPKAAYRAAKQHINTVERPEWSSLLRKPLALDAGGIPHEGGHSLPSRDDRDWQRLRGWIALEQGGGEGRRREELSPLQRRFADEVLPVLRDRGCMVARCHGPQVMFGGLAFQPPMDGSGGDFSTAEVEKNHELARHNLALAGEPGRSRLLVKALPLAAGGVIHRGGNDVFFPAAGNRDPRQDPGAQAILGWAAAERAAVVADAAVRGVVFVRGPELPHALLDLGRFRPGSDLFFYPGLTAGATPKNLTAALHPEGPADIRDPQVSHDGTRIAFAMRRSADDCHNLYELRLDGGGLRQLTFDRGLLPGGVKVVNRFPTYGPKGRLFFSSSRGGTLDETSRGLDLDLYELAPTDGATPIRLTHTPTPELDPTFLAIGEFRGTMAFTVVRRLGGRFEAPIFRFPPDRSAAHPQADYHPHHGQTSPGEVALHLRELPDGRDVAVHFDRDGLYRGGLLSVIERQLGPDVPNERLATLSVPGFRRSVSIPDPRVNIRGPSGGGLYRDPAPLPDGRLVIGWAPGPVELGVDDPARRPDVGLYVVTLGNDADGGATLAERRLLTDAPGLADDQPAVVVARPEEDDDHEYAWDPAQPTGRLHLAGGAAIVVVNQDLRPAGPKPVPAGVAGLRVSAWASPTAANTRPVEPSKIANRDPASTWWSNGVHGPTLLVAEAPLFADGSLFVEGPAGVPLLVQVTNAQGFAVGRQLAFWPYLQGGWKYTAGAPIARYGRLCAACHGAIDGNPDHALPPPRPEELDVVASASVTLGSHQDRDPRRPKPPIAVATKPLPDFHFRRDLGPLLGRACAVAGCHAAPRPAGGLDLTPTPTAYYDAAYEALQAFGDGSTGGKKYIDERGASAWGSFLLEKVSGRELGAPRRLDFRCPPGRPPLDEQEVQALGRWIDRGAIYRTPGAEAP